MKVKVIRKFRDRHTNVLHNKNTELEITRERFEEIALSGLFVKEIKTKKAKE